jgi:hypothetical protein
MISEEAEAICETSAESCRIDQEINKKKKERKKERKKQNAHTND